MAIVSFSDLATQDVFRTGRTSRNVGWRNILKVVKRKLDMLEYAAALVDLKSPPGNRLELLRGDLAGFYSIRINDQWRIVFRWGDGGPRDVKICDYH